MKNSDEFFAAHDADPKGVYLAEVGFGRNVKFGVFSTMAKAKSWMARFPLEDGCICVPFFLDMPEEGCEQ